MHGSEPSFSRQTDESFVDRAWKSVEEGTQRLRETSWDEALAWGHDTLSRAKEKARRLFLYLTGEAGSSSGPSSYPYSSSSSPGQGSEPPHQHRRETQIGRSHTDEKGSGGFWSSLAGLFSGISLKSANVGVSGAGSGAHKSAFETFEEGEVHCDLVKVCQHLIVRCVIT